MRLFNLIILLFVVNTFSIGQNQFYIPLRITDSLRVGSGSIWYGVHPSASYCIPDTVTFTDGKIFREQEEPPPPPSQIFDIRFVNLNFGADTCLGQGVIADIRKYTNPNQIDTFSIRLQLGSGIRPFIFSWPAGLNAICDSMKLYEEISGFTFFNVNMLTTTRFRLTLNLNSAKIIKYGAKSAPQTAPVATPLYRPGNGTINVFAKPVMFEWDGAYGALQYFLEIASDTNFINIVRIDTINISTQTPFNTGTAISIDLNYQTKYFWRVRSKNNFGISPYSVIYSFTTAMPVVPPPPKLVYPDSGLGNVIKSPLLRWRVTDRADRYHLIVATDTGFTPSAIVLNDSTIVDTSKQLVNLKGGARYFWKVRARNISGYGAYSSRFFFTTILPVPPTPSLLAPANNDTALAINPTLSWSVSEDAELYHLQVATDQGFNTIVINDSTITTTSKQINLNNFTIYYWRVKAKNATGSSNFSSIWQFKTIIAIPTKPVLFNPANNDTNVSLTPTLFWNSVPYAATYELNVASDQNFNTIIYSNSNLTSTSQQIPTLISDRIYYWRVRASNYAGTSLFSDVWNFKTILIPPEGVLLSSPANNSDNIIVNPTLRWNASDRAVKYHYQVDSVSIFNFPLFEDSNYTGLSKTIGTLESGKKYYWRVRGWNRAGYGNYSEIWNFTTVPYPKPGISNLKYPPNGAPNISLNPTLKWDSSEYAEVYILEVSRDSLFTIANRVLLDTNISVRERKVGPLNQTTRYFWRVRAKNKAGVGLNSEVWNFRTYGDQPASWVTPFVVLETGLARDTLRFGVHPEATYGIDVSLGEYELPQVEPGTFDVRWVSPPRRPGILGEGTRLNLTPFLNFTQIDTYRVKFQTGVGTYPLTIRWSSPFIYNICDSMEIRDEIGGYTVRVRMDLASSTVINNDAVKSLVIIKWGARPLGIKVENTDIPKAFALYPNYPNPFNPSTRIKFSILKETRAVLTVYNMLGEKITTLTDNYFFPGTYIVDWNATDDKFNLLTSGVYFIRMSTESSVEGQEKNFTATQKMLLMK